MKRRAFLKWGGAVTILGGGGYLLGQENGTVPDVSLPNTSPVKNIEWTDTGKMVFTVTDDHGKDKWNVLHQNQEYGEGFLGGPLPEFGGEVTVDFYSYAREHYQNAPSPNFNIVLFDMGLDDNKKWTSFTVPDRIWQRIT